MLTERVLTSIKGTAASVTAIYEPGPGGTPARRFLWFTGLVLVGLLLIANAILMATAIGGIISPQPPTDWLIFETAVNRILGGASPYFAGEAWFRWSPIAAYVMVPLVALGPDVWRFLHLVAALAVVALDRRLGIVMLLSFPFWTDVGVGNAHVFFFVAALAALMGFRVGIASYLILFLLVPRPMLVPIVIWILYTRPAWRRPFAILVLVNLAAIVAVGFGDDWLRTTFSGSTEFDNPLNFGLSRIIGWAWMPVGIALGSWVAYRGRIGIASVLVSPYLLPPYLLMALLDLRRADGGITRWTRTATRDDVD